jgi:ABC-type phosphate/phosphonate transport system substrate-binding protein
MLSVVSDKHAIAATKPMLDLLGHEVGVPFGFELAPAKSFSDIVTIGQSVDAGTKCHVAVLWGLEYGWLRDRCPRLRILALLNAEPDAVYRSQIMVCKDSPVRDFRGLRGTRLALFERVPLIDLVFLEKQLQDCGATRKKFFSQVKVYPTIQEAVFAVHDQKADCIVVNRAAYSRHVACRPQVRLQGLAIAELPGVIVVGRPEVINRFRPGLWEEVRGKLEVIHLTVEGQQCVDFWNVQRFARPDEVEYERFVRKAAAEYPSAIIERLAAEPRR